MYPSQRLFQKGTFAVEFAIIFILLLTLLFGVIELARLMYMYNTLTEVTRRAGYAASVTNFRDQAAMELVRQRAIFREGPGGLVLGDPITDENILIDYLSLVRESGNALTLTPIPAMQLPASPQENRLICLRNPNDPTCMRFVRVRVCASSDTVSCHPVHYRSLFGLFPSIVPLPISTTISTVETLGDVPGVLHVP